MRNALVRSFVVAQTLVGVVLTVVWLARLWESRLLITIPMYAISAALLVAALIPDAWIPTPVSSKHMESPSPRDMPAELREPGGFAAWNRFSIEAILTSGFVLITALLLQTIAPTPSL
jgi:hypothetical protein